MIFFGIVICKQSCWEYLPFRLKWSPLQPWIKKHFGFPDKETHRLPLNKPVTSWTFISRQSLPKSVPLRPWLAIQQTKASNWAWSSLLKSLKILTMSRAGTLAYPLTMKCNSFLKKQPNLSAKKPPQKTKLTSKRIFIHFKFLLIFNCHLFSTNILSSMVVILILKVPVRWRRWQDDKNELLYDLLG